MFPQQPNLAREILIRRGTGHWRVSTRLAEAFDMDDSPLVCCGSREDALELLRLETGIAEIMFEDVHPAAAPENMTDLLAEVFAEAFDFLELNIWGDVQLLSAGRCLADTIVLRHVLPPRLAQFYDRDMLGTFRVALNAVAAKLSLYLVADANPYLTSTAEELAALALIREVKSMLAETISERDFILDETPEEGEDDHLRDAFELVDEMLDELFEHPHAGILFDDIAATIDDPRSPLLRAFGPTYLHPDEWFTPFDETDNGMDIVELELGEHAGDFLDRGMRKRVRAIYGEPANDEPGLLDGLLTCGECGSAMVRVGDEYVCTGEERVLQ